MKINMIIKNKNKVIQKIKKSTTMILVSNIHKIWINKLKTGKIKLKMKIKIYPKN